MKIFNTIRQCLLRGNKFQPRLPKFLLPSSQSRTEAVEKPPRIKEEPNYYHVGGYHRVSLGDTFDSGKYTVLRKLGYGEFSTVWLARNSKAQKYVALKILRADAYGGEIEIFERDILKKITEVSMRSSHEGRHHVSHLVDEFTHVGPHGEHVCLVFDVLSHHLYYQAVHFEAERIPVGPMKCIARQLLLGLDFLHRECGVIHTDLQPTNIVFELENPNEAVSRYLSDVPPRVDDSVKGSVIPLREVIGSPIVTEQSRPNIRIIDLGVASWIDRRLTDHIQSPALRAPEVTIGAPWGTAVDIWSLGCVLIEFIHGYTIFRCKDASNGMWTADDDRLGKMIEAWDHSPRNF